jgi:hypothetical protein
MKNSCGLEAGQGELTVSLLYISNVPNCSLIDVKGCVGLEAF